MIRFRLFSISAFLLTAACSHAVGPTDVASSESGGISCTVTVSARAMNCGGPSASVSGLSLNVTLGGPQGTYLRLASTPPAYTGTVFSTSVTVENLTAQPMGTADGSAADPAGVRVFFVSGPTTTSGTGTVTVDNEDGLGTLTAAGQPYFQYAGVLDPGEISTAKSWQWNVPASVNTFSFSVMVSAKLPDDAGVLRWSEQRMGEQSYGDMSEANGQLWTVGTGGSILHYTGTTWETQASPVAGVTLHAVRMRAGTPITGIAVGERQTIIRYNGTEWTTVTTMASGGATYIGMCSITPSEMYIVGTNVIGHSTNADQSSPTFNQETTPTGVVTDYYICGGANSNDVYASGLNGVILHTTGNGTWTQQTSGTTNALRAMTVIRNGNGSLAQIWVTGGTPGQGPGIMLRSSGNGTWTPVTVPGGPILRSLKAFNPSNGNDIYGVGTGGVIVHWNGTTWSSQGSGTTEQLNDIEQRALPGGGREWWIDGNIGILMRGTR